MAAPWVAGAQARIVGRIHGQTTINVLHFATNDQIQDEPALDTLLLQLAQNLLECAIETLLPAVTADWALVQCDAKRIYPQPSDPIIATAPGNSFGQLSAASASFESTLLNLRTGGGGKSGRGRMFLPPAGEDHSNESLVDGNTLVLIAAFATCLAGKFLGQNPSTAWRLGVLSQKINKQAIGGGFDNAFRVVTSLNPKADIAVMRSRRIGRGV